MSRSQRIHDALSRALTPETLTVTNESHRHHVPKNSETHFKVFIVSQQFEGLSRIDRHRRVHAELSTELQSGLHALSLHLFSPDEWKNRPQSLMESPACKDGYDRDGSTHD